ncbi:SHOCT domain-containing protein [Clostridiaceae bacterium]|nr:SHOCT domain-containing protein [Clostridiaceae bacterium]
MKKFKLPLILGILAGIGYLLVDFFMAANTYVGMFLGSTGEYSSAFDYYLKIFSIQNQVISFLVMLVGGFVLGMIINLFLGKSRQAKQATDVDTMLIADELKKYKQLLDDGTISQEEFNAKKKQLLGR